jgi:hypothetical protein
MNAIAAFVRSHESPAAIHCRQVKRLDRVLLPSCSSPPLNRGPLSRRPVRGLARRGVAGTPGRSANQTPIGQMGDQGRLIARGFGPMRPRASQDHATTREKWATPYEKALWKEGFQGARLRLPPLLFSRARRAYGGWVRAAALKSREPRRHSPVTTARVPVFSRTPACRYPPALGPRSFSPKGQCSARSFCLPEPDTSARMRGSRSPPTIEAGAERKTDQNAFFSDDKSTREQRRDGIDKLQMNMIN